MKTRKNKILIQRADRLGDVVLTLPVIDALHAYYPNSELHVLTSKIGKEFLEGHPYIKKVFVYDNEIKPLIEPIKQEKFDIYISLWNDPKLALLGALCRIPTRIGDRTNLLQRLFYTQTVRQKWEDLTRHQIEFNLDLLTPLGIPSQLSKGMIPISEEARHMVFEVLKKWVNPEKKKVLIFTGTGGTNVPIPEHAIANFIRLLSEQKEYQVILAGQADPGSFYETFSEFNVLNLVGKTTMQELVALIYECDFYVGPDTGPTQIASFFEKPMIFFSSMKPNPPARWGSLSPLCRIIRREYICEHPPTVPCNPNRCFGYLTGKLLYQKFGELLSQKSLNEHFVGSELKQEHLKHTLRVLYPTTSIEEYDRLFNALNKWREKGVMIFPYVVPRWDLDTFNQLRKYIIKHNISVIQGPAPFWITFGLQLIMGVVYKYQKPSRVTLPLYPGFEAEELLTLYSESFA